MKRIASFLTATAVVLAPAYAGADDTIVIERQQNFGPAITYAPPKDHTATTVVNVLVRYAENVRDGRTNSAWNDYLHDLFETVNKAFADSGTQIEMNVVASQLQTGLSATADNQQLVGQLASLADIEDWRASLDAHLVVLLREYQSTHGSCGAARLPVCGNDADCYTAAHGFSVVSVDPAQCGDTGIMIAHQLAHNLGAAHESTDPMEGTFPYSHAHVLSDGRGTVMAWAGATNGRIARFSAPGDTCSGEPCGEAAISDNAATLEETRHYVARWLTDRSLTVSAPASVRADDDLDVAFAWFGVLGDTFDVSLYRNGTQVALLANDYAIPSNPTARERNAGETTVTIPESLEPGTDYTIRVTSSQVPSVSGEAQIEILEAAPKSVIQFAQSRVVADGSSASVAVQRQGDVTKSVSVDYATMGGSAHAGTNYTAVSGTLTWAAGETAAKSVTVANLRAAESGNEISVFIVLSDPSDGAKLGDTTTAEIVIPAKAGGGAIGGGGGGGAMGAFTLALLAALAALGPRRRPARRTAAAGAR